jgi:diguanylate cyclase (GGDEF)-like protein
MMQVNDHLCSTECLLCKVLNHSQGQEAGQESTAVNSLVLEEVRKLEQLSMPSDDLSAPFMEAASMDLDKLGPLDSLTELYNYQSLLKELKDAIKRAKRYKHSLTFCIISVDEFEQVSEQFGALTTDAVLKVIANVLKASVHDSDFCAKYDTNKFAIIFPDIDISCVALLVEQIRQKIGTHSVTHNWRNIKVTISAGLATFPRQAQSHDELIALAIQAAGESTRRGGDRVCIA